LQAATLPLLKEPRRTCLPEKHREIAAVDPVLKGVLRELVTGKRNWPLFMYGEPGTGKSCAALALCDYLLAADYVFMTAAELTSRVMDTFGKPERFDWRIFAPYREKLEGLVERGPVKATGSRLVVLDELGTRTNVSDTHYECVQKVLDMREGVPLILISNLDARGLAKVYDDRIASRCSSGTVVPLKGRDRRIHKGS
jgi:DNA replication protein DnaC